MDEAHRLRNVYKPDSKTARTLRNALAAHRKLLLTATPLQNSLLELFGLVSFLDDQVFGDLESFRAQFGALRDPDSLAALRRRIQPLTRRTLRQQVQAYVKYTRRIPLVEDFRPGADEQRLYDLVSDYLQRERLLALPNAQRQLITLVLRKLLASSSFAIAGALASLLRRLHQQLAALAPAPLIAELDEDYEALDETADEGAEPVEEPPPAPPESVAEIAAIREEIADLLTYAKTTGQPLVKPFLLVIARDTTHAAALQQLLTTQLFDGRYAGKVLQVDSGTTSGAEGDEVVRKLLAVESVDEPTEIVIHVNMLKEGWDVTNLYTIVPLRAANARTLIEQSIGRGLRLPYGRRTGVEAVDRLNIIAHDRFQEVVDEAGRGDSPIRLKQLQLDPAGDGSEPLRSVAVTPTLDRLLGIAPPAAAPATPGAEPVATAAAAAIDPADRAYPPAAGPATPLFSGDEARLAAVAFQVIRNLPKQATATADSPALPTSAALMNADVQGEILRRVQARTVPVQGQLVAPEIDVADVVRRTAELVAQQSIDIPRIIVKPKGAVSGHYAPIALDLSRLNFQPQDQQIVGRGLQTGREVLYGRAGHLPELRPEDYILRELVDFDDVSYDDHAELLNDLAARAVAHFRSYLPEEADLRSVLSNHGRAIAENLHAQLAASYVEDAGEMEVVVTAGFTPLRPAAVTASGDVRRLDQVPEDRSRIASLVYGHFTKCAYDYQKFHSDTERLMAVILERDSQRWFRPVAGQFGIWYRRGIEQPEYVPDFVTVTATHNLMIETKRAVDMETEEVRRKAEAARQWCAHASEYARAHGGLAWRYLLIPHDAVMVNATLEALATRYS
jgi:type III restriction enzyme